MVDLVAYLSDRLDEDEREAHDALTIEGAGFDDPEWRWVVLKDGSHRFAPGAPSPTRVLAEIAAKRAILGLHRREAFVYSEPHCSTCVSPEPTDGELDMDAWPCPTILALAQVYADRPDFDAAWKTEAAHA